MDLDPQSGAARSLDLCDRAVAGHILGFDFEFLVRVQVKVGDCDLCTQSVLVAMVTRE